MNGLTVLNNKDISGYLKALSKRVPAGSLSLSEVDVRCLEGIQKDIDVFSNVSMPEIKFITKNFSVLNIAHNCNSACTHCLRNASSEKKSVILWDDLVRFTDGFKKLNERLDFDVFNENKYLVLHDDFNPPEVTINDLEGHSYNFADAVKLVFKKLHIPVETVTSGWNKADTKSEIAAKELVNYLNQNPEANALTSVSVNPFHGLLEKSRMAANQGKPEQARFWRNIYTQRIAHAIETFLPLFKDGKASLIYRHAGGDFITSETGSKETSRMYREIYARLEQLVGKSVLEQIPVLKPEYYEFEKSERFIEPKGRGRRYFSAADNLKKQRELIAEKAQWETSFAAKRVNDAYKYTIKEVDISGNIYAGTLSECMIPTGIQLNYLGKDKSVPTLFSDIKLSKLTKEDICEFI